MVSTTTGHYAYVLDWSTRKQKYTSLSTGQAETVALTVSVRQVDDTIDDISLIVPHAYREQFLEYYICAVDATAAIAAVRRGWSRTLATASRVVGCSIAWLHDRALTGRCRLVYEPGTSNPSDALTKLITLAHVIYTYLDTRVKSEDWRIGDPGRTDALRHHPLSVQIIHDGKTQSCIICGCISDICFKCKACTMCGCECPPEAHDHPLANHLA